MSYEKEVIEYYGAEHQLIVAIEELSELTKELTKALRGNPSRDRIIEETGDVQVVIPQIMEIFEFTLNDTFPVMLTKQERTRGIMHAEGETDDQTD